MSKKTFFYGLLGLKTSLNENTISLPLVLLISHKLLWTFQETSTFGDLILVTFFILLYLCTFWIQKYHVYFWALIVRLVCYWSRKILNLTFRLLRTYYNNNLYQTEKEKLRWTFNLLAIYLNFFEPNLLCIIPCNWLRNIRFRRKLEIKFKHIANRLKVQSNFSL